MCNKERMRKWAFLLACFGSTAAASGQFTRVEAQQFLDVLLRAMDGDAALTRFIEPDALTKLQAARPDLSINRYGVGQWQLEAFQPPRVDVKLSHNKDGAPDWIRMLTFNLTKSGDKLYVLPGAMAANGYVDPWQSTTYLPNGRALVFYLLPDEDALVTKASPRFVAKYLNGDSDFGADTAPAMTVDGITTFLASDAAKVAAMELKPSARAELRELKAWLGAAKLPVVGYQIERP